MSPTAAESRPVYPAWAREPAPWWRVSEPSTVLTDLALAVLTSVLALRLASAGRAPAAPLLAGALAATAATALAGAVVHGATRQLGERRWRLLWRLTLQLAALVSFLLLAGVAAAELRGATLWTALAAAALKLAAVAAHTWRTGDFRWIVADSGGSLALVAALQATAWATRGGAGAPAAPWILAGVGVSVAAGLAQRAGRGPHRHLNHNDVYHLGQMLAAWLLYRGFVLLVRA